MAEFLEILMLLSFGASWPVNVIKSYNARTAKGKSALFLYLILFGYVAGVAAKLVDPDFMARFSQKWYVLLFYVLNFVMVFLDLLMYFRNNKLDKQAEIEAKEKVK